ncbi:hypothetical protein KVR01_003315 [Diaporthe batatas]|uniref:uncharacterized protein n=1 Tax=Diaporthe batatas TaxID=748121 RepID=UPI001D03C443|nr:uncharacterized protein KVR01_003315 [Diaporthe batatas]KAG8167626.1 hypothetical protein KVR01_003315 [Diaporthe batatas]
MDPLSAIGLVSGVITFIDFGYEVISAAREVRASSSGTTAANNHIKFLNERMEAVASDLTVARSSGIMSADNQRLTELADKCLELSGGLKKLLDKLRAKNPKSKRQVLSSIMKNVKKKDEKKNLEARLDKCRQQLHLQLSHTTRLESLSRLDEIVQTGKCYDKELRSLNQQLAVLKDAVAGLNPNSKLQDEARAILDLSDLAISKVLQNGILEALRFEKMESRFDSIVEAHPDTFKWLLEEESPDSSIVSTGDMNDQWFSIMNDAVEQDIPLRLEIRKSFTNWLSHGNGIFHISGKPGAGKSTLMKYLSDSNEIKKYMNTWADGKEITFASFFFWRHGTEFQKSLHGLLRSLLHSVIDGHPDLARMVFPTQWEAARTSPGKTLHFHLSDIQKAFEILMETPEVYTKHKFAFFVDGLDEFEGHDDSLVKTLFQWAHSGSENIKILVSSRELPIFQQRFSKCPKFRLHEATYRDIFLFVYDTLRENEDVKSLSQPQEVARLGRLLVERAEGVFLWVSLAMRLVERGLVLEESIEELESAIEQLPHELEQLFRVIFDSIKTERDLAKRRKAMRTLSLAVDEIQVPACNGRLYLTHLSFMNDYDRDPDFSSQVKSTKNAADRSARLSRCRKQLGGGCRGLLTIRSYYWEHEVLVRKETVVLTHRSLIEFFQLPDVQVSIKEYTRGFDRLLFYCQSLIAELKVWSLDEEYDGLEDILSSITPHGREDTKSEALYGRLWVAAELERLISLHYHIHDSNKSTLISTISQVRLLIQSESESTWASEFMYISLWRSDGTKHFTHFIIPCQLEDCIVLVALKLGLHELWPTTDLEGKIRDAVLCLVAMSLEGFWMRDRALQFVPPSFDRLLHSLAICLGGGTSTNSIMRLPSGRLRPSVWQNMVWHCIVTPCNQASVAPVWLLFILHGADTRFTLNFKQTCNFSARDKNAKTMEMTGLWGPDGYQTQIHTPILIDEDEDGILGLARNRNWSVSLEELAYFWFVPHVDSFRKVFELYGNSHISEGAQKDLGRELGFDLECWQSQTWGDPRPLLRYPWEGETEALRDSDRTVSADDI